MVNIKHWVDWVAQVPECTIFTVWSRIVTLPMKSPFFAPKTLYNTIKTINSEAAADIYKHNGIRIIKHSNIEPNSKMFMPDGKPTTIARQQFLDDLNNYIKEVEAEKLHRDPHQHSSWYNNAKDLQLRLAQNEADELRQHVKLLEDQARKIQKKEKRNNQSPDREATQSRFEVARAHGAWHDKRAFTWAGRHHKSSIPPCERHTDTRREHFQHRRECDQFGNNPQESGIREFQEFQQFKEFQKWHQSWYDASEVGNVTRHRLEF